MTAPPSAQARQSDANSLLIYVLRIAMRLEYLRSECKQFGIIWTRTGTRRCSAVMFWQCRMIRCGRKRAERQLAQKLKLRRDGIPVRQERSEYQQSAFASCLSAHARA